MEEIRAFSEEHVRDVANLYLRAIRGQARPAPPALEDEFRESFLRNPWMSPDITPLVYMENGKLVGFLGVIPRPMEFRGRPIRVATITIWLVDHESHRGLAGLKLLKHLLGGPQDFSITDGAGNDASSVYTAAGAQISRLYSFNWVRLLRPFQTARGVFDRVGLRKLKGAAGLLTAPADLLLSKISLPLVQAPKSPYASKSASPTELLECIQESRGREALKPAYAMPSFGWLLSHAARATRYKELRTKIAYSPNGAPAGWFIYYSTPGQPAYVLQIGAQRKLQFKEVLLALFQDAWEQGASAVKGQIIPEFATTLTEQQCLFRQPHACVIGYSRDREIMHAFHSADAALSRLDAGFWLRFSTEDWL